MCLDFCDNSQFHLHFFRSRFYLFKCIVLREGMYVIFKQPIYKIFYINLIQSTIYCLFLLFLFLLDFSALFRQIQCADMMDVD